MARKPHKQPETVATTRMAATARGVPPRATSALVSATAADRHNARAKAFIDAAHAEHLRVTSSPAGDPRQAQRDAIGYAIAVIVLDAFGIITDSGPTPETTKIHHRAFRTGCGPRVGNIAPVTHAAAREAVDKLYGELFALEHAGMPQPGRGCPFIMIAPSMSFMGISIKPSACSEVVLRVEPTEAVNSQSPGWLRTLAIEGLRRAMGYQPWFELRSERKPTAGEHRPSASIFDLIVFSGSPGEWGLVLDAIIERERLDKVADQITKIVTDTATREPLFWLPPWKPPHKRRVGLAYIERWLAMALGDESAMPVIFAAQQGSASEVANTWAKATKNEFDWMAGIERTAAMMIRLSPKLGAGTWSRDWLSFATSIMIASAAQSEDDAQLGYAERAVRALHQFGTPVLSPEPSLGLQFDECEGCLLLSAVTPAATNAVRSLGCALVRHIIAKLQKRNNATSTAEYLCGARIIGTMAEWQAVLESMA